MAFNPKNLVKVFEAGDPFRNDPPDAESYYAAIGRIVAIWGRFEQMLEQSISMMSVLSDAPKPNEPPQVSYKRKLGQMKVLCRDTPSLNHIHDAVRTFASTAKILGNKRHELTHANWQGFSKKAPEPTVIFSNISWDTARACRG